MKGFSRADYKEVIRSFDRIHFSEISIIEAKAKCQKMGEMVNEKFNELLPYGLDFFDRIILAQAFNVGNLLTEDSKLLKVKNPGMKILNWDAMVREIGLK